MKEFGQPALNQTRLLDVFQEEGWVEHIDDPLPPVASASEDETKQRLHDTIKNLNRGLRPGTIHFRGDGTGQGVIWELAAHRRKTMGLTAMGKGAKGSRTRKARRAGRGGNGPTSR